MCISVNNNFAALHHGQGNHLVFIFYLWRFGTSQRSLKDILSTNHATTITTEGICCFEKGDGFTSRSSPLSNQDQPCLIPKNIDYVELGKFRLLHNLTVFFTQPHLLKEQIFFNQKFNTAGCLFLTFVRVIYRVQYFFSLHPPRVNMGRPRWNGKKPFPLTFLLA